MALTFISGYVNSYTYATQGRRFAGVQTGNLLSFAIKLSENNIKEALNFLLPIFVFMLGQAAAYFLHRWAHKQGFHWYLFSSLILTFTALITALFTPFISSFFTVSALAFFASLQVETFKSLRGAHYANVMMTGNIKNAAYLFTKGIYEANKELLLIARNTFIIILTFALGVGMSMALTFRFGEASLFGLLCPLLYLNYLLAEEAFLSSKKYSD
ncbi:YoaK family protein [Streptococcus didelphis]|uniref:YoaK family protein n=1 Tax=Streptococcus didelphis TaxID=102886 RepID=UPI0009FE69A3|nr:YoaK family protein [Streptococcus didelphis]WMB30194.1 YoaK family protein [Streptococcus didelphis]